MELPAQDPAADAALTVVRTLRDAGHVAYFAGGCVRDRLLGLAPKDYDVATDAPPDRVRQLFRNTQAVGAAFGVILVRLAGAQIEVATFRSDGQYADGRRPESVTFSTAAADAERRDFSINGLFFDPIAGHVIDYVDGQADLAARVLRAIGTPGERFAEDHLRLLRAVRFAARFGLSVEPNTAAAIDAAAPLLPRISAERIAEELRRILTAPTRDAAYRLLWRHGLLRVVLPTISGDAVPLDEHRSLLWKLAPGAPVPFPVAWLAVLLDVRWHGSGFKQDVLGYLNANDARKLVALTRTLLRPSNDELESIAEIAQQCNRLLTTASPDDALLKRFLARPTSTQSRRLLDAVASLGLASDRIAALRPRFEALLAAGDVAPPPLLTGDTLIRHGARPGPAFKGVLDAVYDAQLNGHIFKADEALALGQRLLGEATTRPPAKPPR